MNKLKYYISFPIFKRFALHPTIQDILESKGLHTATPIQELMLGTVAQNKLLIGPTGTGKTYAYLLPMLSDLKRQEEEAKKQLTEALKIRALIVVPSRELVEQVCEASKDFTRPMKLISKGLGSGKMTYRDEAKMLATGVDVLVTTIDRLQKHRKDQNLYLSRVSHCIIDEIDTLLDARLDQNLQYLSHYFLNRQAQQHQINITLCGATRTGKVDKFVEDNFKDNIKLLIEKKVHMHLENLFHDFIHCTSMDKGDPFLSLYKEALNKSPNSSIMVFCNTITSCHYLEHLCRNNEIKAVALHGDVPKQLRTQNVEEFKQQRVKVMIATDLAARGLDFTFVDSIINFDFPTSTSDYLHRAGRAGRAGRKGFVFSLYHQKEEKIINELKEANDANRPIEIKESAYSRGDNNTQRVSQNNKPRSTSPRSTRPIKGFKPQPTQPKQERTSSIKYKTRIQQQYKQKSQTRHPK